MKNDLGTCFIVKVQKYFKEIEISAKKRTCRYVYCMVERPSSDLYQ